MAKANTAAPATAAAKAAAVPPKDTITYVVTHVPIRHKGHMYPVDSDIELTGAEADNLAGLVMRKDSGEAADSAAGADTSGDGVSGE